jgi:hypothetical protein
MASHLTSIRLLTEKISCLVNTNNYINCVFFESSLSFQYTLGYFLMLANNMCDSETIIFAYRIGDYRLEES